MDLDLERLRIVFDLANANALDEDEAREEDLIETYDAQQDALNYVEGLLGR